MVWRISAQHKKLQTRMDHMRKFRRQHDQLRMVIVRVLRPFIREATSTVEPDEIETSKQDAFTIAAADANAIAVS